MGNINLGFSWVFSSSHLGIVIFIQWQHLSRDVVRDVFIRREFLDRKRRNEFSSIGPRHVLWWRHSPDRDLWPCRLACSSGLVARYPSKPAAESSARPAAGLYCCCKSFPRVLLRRFV